MLYCQAVDVDSEAEDEEEDDSEAFMFGYIQPGELVTGKKVLWP